MASELIPIERARELILGTIRTLPAEQAEIGDALDRVLATDVISLNDVPSFASSAMDGYALAAGPGGRILTVVGESRAGVPPQTEPSDDEAMRISTGAAVPASTNAVIRQEDVELDGAQIRTLAAVKQGANIRGAGEDLRAGTTALRAGSRLCGPELGAAVAAGVARLQVARRPRLSLLCTGDELRAPGEPLALGQIHNSNAPMLAALATRAGGEVGRAERVRDDRGATEQAFAAALDRSDVVVVSGGVSVGPHDHVRPALAALGVRELFWGVALQPGKPTWFGTRGEQLVFGLPGNPVSAVVTFTLFVAPALGALQGLRAPETEQADGTERIAELGAAVRRDPARAQALRVRLAASDGHLIATPNGSQGSHLISSLLGAHALALIPPGDGRLEPGALVGLVNLDW